MTSGNWFGRWKLLKIQSGSVWMPAPDVNFVTMISSNERAKASRAPAIGAVLTAGKVTRREVVDVSAPRSADASSVARREVPEAP